jgi:hypothetical protein
MIVNEKKTKTTIMVDIKCHMCGNIFTSTAESPFVCEDCHARMEEKAQTSSRQITISIPMTQIVEDIRNHYRPQLEENLAGLMSGKIPLDGEDATCFFHYLKVLNTLDKLPLSQSEKLSHYEMIAEMWSDFCSTDFFLNNPRIHDVLMVVSTANGKALEKFWLCQNEPTI